MCPRYAIWAAPVRPEAFLEGAFALSRVVAWQAFRQNRATVL
jgi:hypothetical protein